MEVNIRQGNGMGKDSTADFRRLLRAQLSELKLIGVLVDDVSVGLVERFEHLLNALVAFGICCGFALSDYRLPTGQSGDQVF
ncbi:hypothetical protein N7536_011432 [Penicillium majusculum]|nr:hypothetical protein N7536_011432 [Penicillium majusculum]